MTTVATLDWARVLTAAEMARTALRRPLLLTLPRCVQQIDGTSLRVHVSAVCCILVYASILCLGLC